MSKSIPTLSMYDWESQNGCPAGSATAGAPVTSGGKNRDLWQALQQAARPHDVSWHWTRGHAGDPLNKRADRLAVRAIQDHGLRGVPDLELADAAVPE